jgi:glutamine amidotransferase
MIEPKVIIIDYGMGNLFSVQLACRDAGLDAVISNKAEDIASAAAVILPGVGAFGDAMENLKKMDLVDAIKKFIGSGKPFLGICLGMQLLMTESEEFGLHQGLNVIEGRVKKLPTDKDKVPQVGWNQVAKPTGVDWKNTLLDGVSEEEYMYFVHSFYCDPEDKKVVLSKTTYAGLEYCSSLQKGNVFACQFHPEKSAAKGLQIYRNLAALLSNLD